MLVQEGLHLPEIEEVHHQEDLPLLEIIEVHHREALHPTEIQGQRLQGVVVLPIKEQLLLQAEVLGQRLQEVAVLHLQEVLVQDLHLGEEINLIFLRKFQ